MNCSPSLLIKWLREFINNLKLDLDKTKNKSYKNKLSKNKLYKNKLYIKNKLNKRKQII